MSFLRDYAAWGGLGIVGLWANSRYVDQVNQANTARNQIVQAQQSRLEQYQIDLQRANQQRLVEQEQEAQEGERRQRNQLTALGIIENRTAASGRIGQTVDLIFQDTLFGFARDDEAAKRNKINRQRMADARFQDLYRGTLSDYNQLQTGYEQIKDPRFGAIFAQTAAETASTVMQAIAAVKTGGASFAATQAINKNQEVLNPQPPGGAAPNVGRQPGFFPQLQSFNPSSRTVGGF